jgi:hypothetical protein
MFAFLQTLSAYSVLAFPFELLLADSIVRSILLAPASILIYSVIKYGKYEKMPFVRQTVNYFVSGLIFIALWLILSYAADYLFFGGEFTETLVNILPFYILTGFMFYLILILFFKTTAILPESTENIDNDIEKSENNEQKQTEPPVNIEILSHIAVKSGQKIHLISVSDILYLQADGDYARIFTDSGKFLKEQTMKYFETNLPPQFVRVHRSYIVNVSAISRIERYEKQNQLLTLKNGYQIKISSTGYKILKQKLNL